MDEVGSIVFALELYLCFRYHKHIIAMLDSTDLVLLCVGPELKQHLLAGIQGGTKSTHLEHTFQNVSDHSITGLQAII